VKLLSEKRTSIKNATLEPKNNKNRKIFICFFNSRRRLNECSQPINTKVIFFLKQSHLMNCRCCCPTKSFYCFKTQAKKIIIIELLISGVECEEEEEKKACSLLMIGDGGEVFLCYTDGNLRFLESSKHHQYHCCLHFTHTAG
jgi:hypothetical protein